MQVETCWTLIRAAAKGDQDARSTFARSYLPVVRAYLAARWRQSPLQSELDDAIQDVFVECLKDGGVVEHADASRAGGFHALLKGTAKNVALRMERSRARRRARVEEGAAEPDLVPADEESLSLLFDRAYAKRVMQEAAELQHVHARDSGEAALRRVEILKLRFQEDLPVRDVATRLGLPADFVHHEFAQARKEFHRALRDVVLTHDPGATHVDRECKRLLDLLS